MRHYCTLFDRSYLSKGLCLHESLMRHSSEPFLLHILAMDAATMVLLDDLQLDCVDVIPLSTFERALNLGKVKQSRTWKEYCWTAASQLLEMLLPWTDGDGVCYVDSDIFIYSDPLPIFTEIGSRSIGITPHRFAEKDRPRLARNGEFNVGTVVIRNTETGRRCIKKWALQTREWCFARNENGKFGDQGFLDSFPSDYPSEVAVIQNLGVNLGPWSVGNFEISQREGKVYVNSDVLIAYHFHEYRSSRELTGWPLRDSDKRLIYDPYIAAWRTATARISEMEEFAAKRRVEIEMESQRA